MASYDDLDQATYEGTLKLEQRRLWRHNSALDGQAITII
jgi:hypothetical protein